MVDLGKVLGIGAYSADRVAARLRGGRGEAEEAAAPHHCEGDHCSHISHHDPGIATVQLRVQRPLDLGRLRHWLDGLLWERESRPEDVYRIKGLLRVAGPEAPFKFVLQAVHELYEVTRGPRWEAKGEGRGEGEGDASIELEQDHVSRIVFIGRNLDQVALQTAVEACCVHN